MQNMSDELHPLEMTNLRTLGYRTDYVKDTVLKWLSPLEPCTRHQEIRSKRLKDTGSWFLNTPEFQTWYRLVYNNEMLDNNPHPALACYGLPGAGKSVMR